MPDATTASGGSGRLEEPLQLDLELGEPTVEIGFGFNGDLDLAASKLSHSARVPRHQRNRDGLAVNAQSVGHLENAFDFPLPDHFKHASPLAF